MRRPGSVLLALALLVLLPGCAGRYKPFTITVERLSVEGVRLSGVGLEVHLLLRNPNPEPLTVERFEYQLTLDEERLGRGYHSRPVEVEGFGQAGVVTSFDLGYLGTAGAVRELLGKDRVEAEVRGTFHVRDARGRPGRLGFRSAASVPVLPRS